MDFRGIEECIYEVSQGENEDYCFTGYVDSTGEVEARRQKNEKS